MWCSPKRGSWPTPVAESACRKATRLACTNAKTGRVFRQPLQPSTRLLCSWSWADCDYGICLYLPTICSNCSAWGISGSRTPRTTTSLGNKTLRGEKRNNSIVSGYYQKSPRSTHKLVAIIKTQEGSFTASHKRAANRSRKQLTARSKRPLQPTSSRATRPFVRECRNPRRNQWRQGSSSRSVENSFPPRRFP